MRPGKTTPLARVAARVDAAPSHTVNTSISQSGQTFAADDRGVEEPWGDTRGGYQIRSSAL
jgi:hypothetical protein